MPPGRGRALARDDHRLQRAVCYHLFELCVLAIRDSHIDCPWNEFASGSFTASQAEAYAARAEAC